MGQRVTFTCAREQTAHPPPNSRARPRPTQFRTLSPSTASALCPPAPSHPHLLLHNTTLVFPKIPLPSYHMFERIKITRQDASLRAQFLRLGASRALRNNALRSLEKRRRAMSPDWRNPTGRYGACARASETCTRSTNRAQTKAEVSAVAGVGCANAARRSCAIATGSDTRCIRCHIVPEEGSTAASATYHSLGPMPCSATDGRSTESEMHRVEDQGTRRMKYHSPLRHVGDWSPGYHPPGVNTEAVPTPAVTSLSSVLLYY
jgi:hypothetical protein